MSAAVVVGLLLAAGEPHSAAGASLIDAATEALGPSVSLVVKHAKATSDAEALRLEAALGAGAVAAISWTPAPATADIRIHLSRGDRWISRQLNFLATDKPSERGRTVGFALASMLLSETEMIVPQDLTETAPAPPPNQAFPPDARRVDAAGSSAPTKAPATPDTPTPTGTVSATTTVDPVAPSHSLELAALGVRGLAGPATGWGGAIHLERGAGVFHLRGGASARVGGFPGLNGYDRVLIASVGVTWRPFDARPTSRAGLGVSLEGALLYHDFSHEMGDAGGDVHRGRTLPGALATIDGTWRVVPRVEAVLGVSSEVAFGTTQVVVAREVLGTVPVLRLQARLGIRIPIW